MEQATVFTGPTEVNRFAMIAVKNAIKLYKNTGMKANRAYTPTNMRAFVEKNTGKKFKARDWDGMIAALEEKLNPEKLPDVAVWHYGRQEFIAHIPCEGEKRVRIDVYDGLENYAVFEVTSDDPNPLNPRMVNIVSDKPLTDWRIDLS